LRNASGETVLRTVTPDLELGSDLAGAAAVGSLVVMGSAGAIGLAGTSAKLAGTSAALCGRPSLAGAVGAAAVGACASLGAPPSAITTLRAMGMNEISSR